MIIMITIRIVAGTRGQRALPGAADARTNKYMLVCVCIVNISMSYIYMCIYIYIYILLK